MHIMFLAQCYAPEDMSAGVLITELATDMVKKGHQVSIITAAPSHPYGQVYEGYQNSIYKVEHLDGVRIIRIWSFISPRKTFWPRTLNYSTYSISSFYGGLFAGKPDIIMSFSPPLPLGMSAWLLSKFWRVPWILQLEDLYPHAAVATGILRNRTAIRFFEGMEMFLYRKADLISIISESFRWYLSKKGIDGKKTNLIPVWADPELVYNLSKINDFRTNNGLTDKFIVMYAGNLGLTSSLEEVMEAAIFLKEDPDICLVIVGEGVKKDALISICSTHQLNNVVFLPYQPRSSFNEMMAAADLHLVTLNQSSSFSSLPSKTFNIMASARPILGIAPPDCELSILIKEAQCGVIIPTKHPRQVAKTIKELKQEKIFLEEMGRNGRIKLEEKYSRSICINQYEEMFSKLYEKTI